MELIDIGVNSIVGASVPLQEVKFVIVIKSKTGDLNGVVKDFGDFGSSTSHGHLENLRGLVISEDIVSSETWSEASLVLETGDNALS